jgi:hypothetical protein
MTVLTVAAALVLPHGAFADDGPGGNNGDEAELHGVVESLPASGLVGDWTVSGTIVHVTDGTEIDQDDAPVQVGSSVEVKGTQESDGSITADEIEVKEAADDDEFGDVEFHGVIESLPDPGPVGDWMVSGRTVHVTEDTRLESDNEGEGGDDQGKDEGGDNGTATFAVGDDVEVKGLAESDGSITATRIEADNEGENEDGDDQGDDNDGTVTLAGAAQRIVRTASHVGMWKVSSHQVRVLKGTKIVRNGRTLHRGAHLRVTGRWFVGGTIRATRIAIVR